METNGSGLVNKCRDMNVTNGIEHVDGQMNDYNERLTSLKEFADKEKERVVEIGKQLDECQIQLAPVEDLIRIARRTLHQQPLFGDEADAGRKIIDDIEVNQIDIATKVVRVTYCFSMGFLSPN